MNYLIGSIKHCNRDKVDIWIKSALEYCQGQVTLLVLDQIIPESLLELEAIGINLVHSPTGDEQDINVCKWERHLKVRQFLQTLTQDDLVLLTDTLDVVFQKDPFTWFTEKAQKNVILTSEGINHKDEPWNMRSIAIDHSEFVEEIESREVINSGLIIGRPKEVSNLLLHTYVATRALSPESADQPALNVALLSSFITDNVQFVNSDDGLAIHSAVGGPTEQFIPWGFANSYKYGLPVLQDGKIINEKTQETFCIVHQYNRVRKWDLFFKDLYKDYKPKRVKLANNNTAVIVCTRANSSYFEDWERTLSYSSDQYILCDVSAEAPPPSRVVLKPVQENFITYTLENVRKTFNFYREASNRHWWNNGGGRNIIWFYPHFRMMYFYKLNPTYDYYWFFDEDVTFPEGRFNDFIAEHSVLDHDCMITYLFSNLNQPIQEGALNMNLEMGSFHSDDANWLTHYPGDGDKHPEDLKETYGSYFPLVRLSNEALRVLVEEHEKGLYGYSEGYVPSILNHCGLSLYSIYGTDSKVRVDPSLIVHHRRYLELEWKNV
jgi:hypothetical protein